MSDTTSRKLEGAVCVVAGATRGAGRGIARALGEQGATVYCTGRSTRGGDRPSGRSETIDETAELVTAAGGRGIAVRVDHTQSEQVRALFERVRTEQAGRLDVVVNDIWGGDDLTQWDKPFWEHSLDGGMKLLQQGFHTHLITAHAAAPLLVARGRGLLVEITDGDEETNAAYRGTLFFDLVKTSISRAALGMAVDLQRFGVTALAVTPGFLRSEAMLERFGVTEANWQDGVKADSYFAGSETPLFVGRAVAALAADPNVHRKAGRTWTSWGLSDEYGFTDAGGARPHWGRFFEPRLAARWAAFLDAVRAEASRRGITEVQDDRRTMTLRTREADGSWTTHIVRAMDVFFAQPEAAARALWERGTSFQGMPV